jgi:hypothetical protein
MPAKIPSVNLINPKQKENIMSQYRSLKLFLLSLGTAIASNVICVSAALATSATGNQNPDFTVSVSIASRGTPDPDVAAAGHPVDVILSARNNKSLKFPPKVNQVELRLTLRSSSGESFNVATNVPLFPEQTARVAFDFNVTPSFPRGAYALTLEAHEVDGSTAPSSATGTLTIV